MEKGSGVLHEICRLCAIESESGVHIFSAEGESNLLEQKIMTCLRIKVARSDPLSKNVCAMCNMLLEEMHQFCCRATSAQETLAYLMNMEKTEDLIKQFKSEASCIKNEFDESLLSTEIDNLNCEFPEFEEPAIDFQLPGFYDNIQEAAPLSDALAVDSQGPRSDEIVNVTEITKNDEQKTAAVRIPKDSRTVKNLEQQKKPSPQSQLKALDVKMANVMKGQSCKIACPTCREVFNSQSEFEAHCQNVHDENPSYACMQCDKKLKNFRCYRSHLNRHDAKYACHKCDKKFARKKPLEAHVLACLEPIRPFECHCGKTFNTKSGLSKHSKLHDGMREYPCTQCNKILQSRGGLRKHVTTHLLGRRFQCHLCGKTFTQKVNLQKHATTHMGDRPFSCTQCNRSFSVKSHLKRHLSSHSQERPFECPVCNKFFKTGSCLKMHAKTHQEFKPYACEECGKEFRILSKLKLHIKWHLSDKPYRCRQCDKKFTSKTSAINHESRCRKLVHVVRAPFKEEFDMQSLMGVPLEPLDSLEFLNIPNFKEENEALFRDSASSTFMDRHDFISLSSGDLSVFEF